MKTVLVKTQSELTAALESGDYPECTGTESFQIYGSAQVTASDSAQVRASGSAQVRAFGSAQVRAYGSAQVTASDSAQVTASDFNAVTIHGQKVKAKGGVQIRIPEIATAKEWCDFYGVDIKKGVAVLFKGVDEDFSTDNARIRGIFYTSGGKPQAADWDGGEAECGGGLHFSPSPIHTLKFNSAAKHFMACPLKVSQIKVHKNAKYPEKIKAAGVCAAIWEVDICGKAI